MELNTVYLMILVGVSVLLIAVGVVVAYLRIVSKYLSLKDELVSINRDLTREKSKILEEAGRESVRIVEEARQKAQEIIKQAQIFSADQESELSDTVKKLSEAQVEQYKVFLQNIQKQVVTMAQGISNQSRDEMLKEIKSFRDTLQSEVARSQSEAKELVLSGYRTIETEVEKYKQLRFRELDRGVFEIIKEISKKVIAKEINAEEHEKLVMKTLEEAKRQNVF